MGLHWGWGGGGGGSDEALLIYKKYLAGRFLVQNVFGDAKNEPKIIFLKFS
jgi:hypothetical protein